MIYEKNIPILRDFNSFLELDINHIYKGKFVYHETTTFPINIFLCCLSDDGLGMDHYINLDGHQDLPIVANHIYFLPCHMRIRFELTAGITFIAMHFNLTFLYGNDVFFGQKRGIMRHDARMVDRINDILEMPDQLQAICKLKAEIFDFCSSCWPKKLGLRAMALQQYSALFRHIHENIDAEMTVENLAEFLHWRRDMFSRNFSRDVGKSPKNFLQDALLKKVMAGLLTRQSSVKDIAEKYHFSSEFYLSRFFKRLTGISPSEYQKKFRQ